MEERLFTFAELKDATESLRNSEGQFEGCGMADDPEIKDYVLSLDPDTPFGVFIALGYELGVQVGLKIAANRALASTDSQPQPETQPGNQQSATA